MSDANGARPGLRSCASSSCELSLYLCLLLFLSFCACFTACFTACSSALSSFRHLWLAVSFPLYVALVFYAELFEVKKNPRSPNLFLWLSSSASPSLIRVVEYSAHAMLLNCLVHIYIWKFQTNLLRSFLYVLHRHSCFWKQSHGRL